MVNSYCYKPSPILRNGHLNTIYPTLFRKINPLRFDRERLITPDADFIDIDRIKQGANRAVILCHGLEGSSDSLYIQGTASILSKAGWDIVAYNYRSCSGEINKQLKIYHSGATDDLDFVFKYIAQDYKSVALVGFSLGGNLCLKYIGERGIHIDSKIIATAAISVPADLEAGSKQIGALQNIIYEKRFLKTLLQKIKLKAQQFPNVIDQSAINQVRSLYSFDDIFTGPLHGFKNAHDYYTQCSSKNFIPDIQIPTLILNAIDDPFLPDACYPQKEADSNQNVNLVISKYGGHVGFVEPKSEYYWNEVEIARFLEKYK